MPKYDFRCSTCGHEFELTRRFSESADAASCPVDGAESSRLFSPPTLLISRGSSGVNAGPPPPSAPVGGDSHGHGPQPRPGQPHPLTPGTWPPQDVTAEPGPQVDAAGDLKVKSPETARLPAASRLSIRQG